MKHIEQNTSDAMSAVMLVELAGPHLKYVAYSLPVTGLVTAESVHYTCETA